MNMLRASKTTFRIPQTLRKCLSDQRRCLSTEEISHQKEGDISSVFRSLSGGNQTEQLPQRFVHAKHDLIKSPAALQAGWDRLLSRLRIETAKVGLKGSSCIPEIEFSDIKNPSQDFIDALKGRGVAVVRQVIPEKEAREFQEEAQRYIAANPSTRAFPPNDPQVFELYWSRPQLTARSHPNMIDTQKFLMSFYHSADDNAECSTKHPLCYADRFRIRHPGDTGFALGPHVDGGSVERWEYNGYGKGHVFDKIFDGEWEKFDPWELSTRLEVSQDLYNGAGACSMFRMFQGWLGMSHTGPNEGTLLVNPLLRLSTAYYLMRPFFKPKRDFSGRKNEAYSDDGYLDAQNWTLELPVSNVLQGAWPGHAQELSHEWHPHLNLPHTMIHVPRIRPGDYVAWHCDTIHAVDSVHRGNGDSSVMYIPACPTTRTNLEYARQQREHFEKGIPPADFPGGVGESQHVGRPDVAEVMELSSVEAHRSMGFAPFDALTAGSQGERSVLEYGNEIMGFPKRREEKSSSDI